MAVRFLAHIYSSERQAPWGDCPAALVDWLEAWNEIGDAFVAEHLAAMSDDYRAPCLAHLVSVGDHHTLAFLAIPDDEVDVERDTLQPSGSCAIYGPFMVATTTEDEWEVVRASLDALWTEEPECLLRTLAMLDGAESMLAAQAARKRLSGRKGSGGIRTLRSGAGVSGERSQSRRSGARRAAI